MAFRSWRFRLRSHAARMAGAALGLLGATVFQPAAAQDIGVVLDQARLVKIPERISTVVIGNPLIADVSVQSGGLMVITGKGYGTTNIVALDRTGAVLMERTVSVLPPRQNVVVVYRGVDRETYSCTPTCDRRITLGDAPAFFDATLAQTANRNAQALGGAQAAK